MFCVLMSSLAADGDTLTQNFTIMYYGRVGRQLHSYTGTPAFHICLTITFSLYILFVLWINYSLSILFYSLMSFIAAINYNYIYYVRMWSYYNLNQHKTHVLLYGDKSLLSEKYQGGNYREIQSCPVLTKWEIPGNTILHIINVIVFQFYSSINC